MSAYEPKADIGGCRTRSFQLLVRVDDAVSRASGAAMRRREFITFLSSAAARPSRGARSTSGEVKASLFKARCVRIDCNKPNGLSNDTGR
jgi:hypothetical protein